LKGWVQPTGTTSVGEGGKPFHEKYSGEGGEKGEEGIGMRRPELRQGGRTSGDL